MACWRTATTTSRPRQDERAAPEGIANSRHRLAQMTALLRERRGTLDIPGIAAVLRDRQRAPDALSCAPASGLTT